MSYLDETRTIRFEGPSAASPRFVAPPVLRWAPVALSRRFTVTVADRDRAVWSATTTEREIDLAPAWPGLAHGPVDVLVQGFNEAGEEVSVRARRRFWRVPGFDGVRPEPGDWAGCVRRAVGYLLAPARDEVAEYERGDPRCAWRSFEDSVTGVRGNLAFPALHHPSFVFALLGFAERYPRDPLAPEAERQALGYGQWLQNHQLPGDWRCGGLTPSTIERGEVGGWVEGGNITLFRAARVGEAFIRLNRYTGEDRYLERTRRIAAVLLDLQRDDGSWPFRVDPRTGETSESYTSAVVTPIRLLTMLEELGAGTSSEIATWRQARDRAEAWLLAGPVADGRWEGMYEDIPGTPAWSNLENWDTNETIRYLLSDACVAQGTVAHAKRLNDYIEDQFVVWRAEESPVTVRCTTAVPVLLPHGGAHRQLAGVAAGPASGHRGGALPREGDRRGELDRCGAARVGRAVHLGIRHALRQGAGIDELARLQRRGGNRAVALAGVPRWTVADRREPRLPSRAVGRVSKHRRSHSFASPPYSPRT